MSLCRVLLTALVAAVACSPPSRPDEATLIVRNGRVWTGAAGDDGAATAIAVVDDRIVAVGADDELSAWIGDATRVIDAGGGLVTPGFIDSHVHFLEGGYRLASVQLRDAGSPEEFTRRIAAFAEGSPAGAWITGGDWDNTLWGGELPSAAWIDSVTPDHPVMANRVDGHMVLANGAAMRAAGVDGSTPDVEGGEIGRDARGDPTGIFRDNAMELILRAVPGSSPEMDDRALAAAMAYVAEQGVTSVVHMGTLRELATFERAHASDRLSTRIKACTPLSTWESLAERVEARGRGDQWLAWGCLKAFVDGSLGSHTALFFEPFDDAPLDSGLFVTPAATLAAWTHGADRAGLQVAIHAIGDRGISTLLDIFQRVEEDNGPRDRRFRMEHAQHIAPDDLGRFAELGVIASMQSYHAIDDGRWAELVIGPERIETRRGAAGLHLRRGIRLLHRGGEGGVGGGAPRGPGRDRSGSVRRTARGDSGRTRDGYGGGGKSRLRRVSGQGSLTDATVGGRCASCACFADSPFGRGPHVRLQSESTAMSIRRRALVAAAPAFLLWACAPASDGTTGEDSEMRALVDQYATVRLTSDMSHLSANDREVVRLLIEAVRPMEDIFWMEAYGDRDAALALAEGDPAARRFIEINYGPWDRLRENEPFIEGVVPKPAGAQKYPADMTVEEFETAVTANPDLQSLYTLVRRAPDGSLIAVPYHEAFADQHAAAAARLREASALASDPGLARYLAMRAEALESDDYRASDMAWMDMKDNPIDVVIGPIETYEDLLFGYKAGHEGYVLIKDLEWSDRLSRFAALLPSLQEGLPVAAAYRQETPGTDSDLNAYDVVYYAGEANAGSKTIAINLPNDEEVQLAKGTRRLQLKNAMQAKFDAIMSRIAAELIVEDQRRHVTFDAFFGNTMFHEVAHGLGVKNTVNGSGTVRTALREHASPMEEGKADVVGLYMVSQLFERGELTEGSIEDHYVTFLAGIFRSIRFGASSAHGRANMVRFNFFQEMGAFTRDDDTGQYRVDFEVFPRAVDALSEVILTLQGDGDYEGVDDLMNERGMVPPELQADLDHLDELGIPRDIVFEQGWSVLTGERGGE